VYVYICNVYVCLSASIYYVFLRRFVCAYVYETGKSESGCVHANLICVFGYAFSLCVRRSFFYSPHAHSLCLSVSHCCICVKFISSRDGVLSD